MSHAYAGLHFNWGPMVDITLSDFCPPSGRLSPLEQKQSHVLVQLHNPWYVQTTLLFCSPRAYKRTAPETNKNSIQEQGTGLFVFRSPPPPTTSLPLSGSPPSPKTNSARNKQKNSIHEQRVNRKSDSKPKAWKAKGPVAWA